MFICVLHVCIMYTRGDDYVYSTYKELVIALTLLIEHELCSCIIHTSNSLSNFIVLLSF